MTKLTQLIVRGLNWYNQLRGEIKPYLIVGEPNINLTK